MIFIDERKKNNNGSHFVIFINENLSVDLKTIGIDLNEFLPLNSRKASERFKSALERKIKNETIQITYKTGKQAHIVKAIEYF